MKCGASRLFNVSFTIELKLLSATATAATAKKSSSSSSSNDGSHNFVNSNFHALVFAVVVIWFRLFMTQKPKQSNKQTKASRSL